MCDFGACNLLPGRYFKGGSHNAPEVFAVFVGLFGLESAEFRACRIEFSGLKGVGFLAACSRGASYLNQTYCPTLHAYVWFSTIRVLLLHLDMLWVMYCDVGS